MICPTCHGQGRRLNPALSVESSHAYGAKISNPHGQPLLVTCDECGGNGTVHCCEGLRAQPETTV